MPRNNDKFKRGNVVAPLKGRRSSNNYRLDFTELEVSSIRLRDDYYYGRRLTDKIGLSKIGSKKITHWVFSDSLVLVRERAVVEELEIYSIF